MKFVHTVGPGTEHLQRGGNMANEPLRKEVDRMFRCLEEEDVIFPGKVEYVKHWSKVPGGGYQYGDWVENKPLDVYCPNNPFHRIEPV
jgi:hypothetical protein